jgi:hypothetical protein
MKKNSRKSSKIKMCFGADIEDELYKAIAEEMRKEFDKEIFIKLGFEEILYSELV